MKSTASALILVLLTTFWSPSTNHLKTDGEADVEEADAGRVWRATVESTTPSPRAKRTAAFELRKDRVALFKLVAEPKGSDTAEKSRPQQRAKKEEYPFTETPSREAPSSELSSAETPSRGSSSTETPTRTTTPTPTVTSKTTEAPTLTPPTATTTASTSTETPTTTTTPTITMTSTSTETPTLTPPTATTTTSTETPTTTTSTSTPTPIPSSTTITTTNSTEFPTPTDPTVKPICYCKNATSITPSGKTLHWPETRADSNAVPLEICLTDRGTSVTRRCLGMCKWILFRGDCEPMETSNTTDALNDLWNDNNRTSSEKLHELLTALNDTTEPLIPYDVVVVGEILKSATTANKNGIDLKALTDTVGLMANANRTVLKLAQENVQATDSILTSYEAYLQQYAKSGNVTHATATNEYVTTSIRTIDTLDDLIVAVYSYDAQETVVRYYDRADQLSFDGLQFAQIVPRELLANLQASGIGDLKHVVTAYKSDSLFQSEDVAKTEAIIANVFMSDVDGRLPNNFTTIYKIFADGAAKDDEDVCSYWLFDKYSRWQNESLAKPLSGRADYRYCRFDHMTHFTVLMGVQLDDADKVADIVIDVLATTGCVLSIIGSVSIVVFAMCFERWRQLEGTPILVNLAVVNLIETSVLMSLDFVGDASHVERHLCTAIGAILQYAVLSQFCWLVIVGFLQYKRFVVVYHNHIDRLMLKSCLWAYGVPLGPVAFALTFSGDDYVNGRNYCYPTGDALLYGTLVPVALLLFVNVVFFGLTFRSLSGRMFKTRDTLLILKLSVLLFFVLGLTWIFGFVSRYLRSKAFSYLFTVCASTQGFVLCVFFILMNKSNRKMMQTAWDRSFIKRFTSFSTSTTTSN